MPHSQDSNKGVTSDKKDLLNWHVAYVKSRSEKKVQERLDKLKINNFLPMIKSVRQWSDRKKIVQLPLFSGYIFVQLKPADYAIVRMVEGLVNFIYEDKKPAIVPAQDIDAIKLFLTTGLPVSAYPDTFETGEQVRINFGPLKGLTGELVDIENEKHFIVRIAIINQIVQLTLPKAYLEKA